MTLAYSHYTQFVLFIYAVPQQLKSITTLEKITKLSTLRIRETEEQTHNQARKKRCKTNMRKNQSIIKVNGKPTQEKNMHTHVYIIWMNLDGKDIEMWSTKKAWERKREAWNFQIGENPLTNTFTYIPKARLDWMDE